MCSVRPPSELCQRQPIGHSRADTKNRRRAGRGECRSDRGRVGRSERRCLCSGGCPRSAARNVFIFWHPVSEFFCGSGRRRRRADGVLRHLSRNRDKAFRVERWTQLHSCRCRSIFGCRYLHFQPRRIVTGGVLLGTFVHTNGRSSSCSHYRLRRHNMRIPDYYARHLQKK
jgi:hypothetical protein